VIEKTCRFLVHFEVAERIIFGRRRRFGVRHVVFGK
jgi:hypothetical protein